MGRDATLNQAANRTPPGAGENQTVNTTSTSAISLTSLVDEYVLFQAKGGTIHFRFGGASISAAVTGDVFLEAGEREEFRVVDGRTHFRAIATTTGSTLIYASTGE